jgi:xanthine dehydrogenase accessory factor
VVSTQGEHDEEALEKALGTNTSYISFIASARKARKVFDFLAAKGLAPELLDRVRVPAGLRIGASSPHEISVSILAEIIQARKTRATEVAAEEATVRASVPVNAKDPVCGMAVEASIANYVSEYRGKVFYFCCSTCKQMFDGQPEAYGLALVEGL